MSPTLIIPTDCIDACKAMLTAIATAPGDSYTLADGMSAHCPEFEAITYLLDNRVIERVAPVTYRLRPEHLAVTAYNNEGQDVDVLTAAFNFLYNGDF